MSDNWDFYALRVDSEPASIYLDLGLAQNAPLESQPHLAYVRVQMRHPRPDGLSSNEEFEDLAAVEDSLSEVVADGRSTTYAGRNTSSGNRDFYFYTSDPVAFAKSAKAAMVGHSHYKFEVGDRLDRNWDVYFDFLYPTPSDLQRILNRRVVDNLAAHGDNLSEPRSIDHFAYLPSVIAAESLRDHLHEQGFIVDEPRIDGGSVAVSFKRTDRPEDIDDVVIPIARRLQELGGEYDGWGCEVIN
ncbi:MAG: DUF695 domain-containing protein [Allosphingosinicella sp.]|uniref:DUF695 domain-containing protein n=1 Tax=Allosphingosinicella sp. TaxID=2823234 RepID=UPI00395A8AF5